MSNAHKKYIAEKQRLFLLLKFSDVVFIFLINIKMTKLADVVHVFILHINFKMPTLVGILTFMRRTKI